MLTWEHQDQGWDENPWLCRAQCLRNAFFMGSRVVMQASQTGIPLEQRPLDSVVK